MLARGKVIGRLSSIQTPWTIFRPAPQAGGLRPLGRRMPSLRGPTPRLPYFKKAQGRTGRTAASGPTARRRPARHLVVDVPGTRLADAYMGGETKRRTQMERPTSKTAATNGGVGP